jgi:hypothetical protein
MSNAGIRSNRGDVYQTLVAFDWGLTILDDPEYQWIEIDSVKYDVDDIVIGMVDGTLICCQCKKNQTNFSAWSLANLSEELNKAYRLLDKNKSAQVRFYSRDSFGKLAKLREYSVSQPDEISYCAGLPNNLKETNAEITKQLALYAPSVATYEFLMRTSFETTLDFDRMEHLLHERLRYMISSADTVYDALWRHLDQLGARSDDGLGVSTKHRLTKDDLKEIVIQAGGVLAQPINSKTVRDLFASTSSIGRSWRREIAGQRLYRSVLGELLSAVQQKNKSILLTGLPGSGKTCVMLELQEALEKQSQKDSSIVPLFIQAREFADLDTVEERINQGLPEKWVEDAARLAEGAYVVVVIDSLDVLSIAREHKVLTYFLSQMDRLLKIPNITVVTACRDFDRKYDLRIAERKWDCEFKCEPLDWDSEVKPFVEAIGIDTANIPSETQDLIRNPREFALYVELAEHEDNCNAVTSQALAQKFLDFFVTKDPNLGNDALKVIETMAEEMLNLRRLSIPHQRVSMPDIIKRRLCSLNIIQETQTGELTFGHQTLLDILVISGALRKGVSLNDFIQNLSPVPFVRPCIRSFIEQLALGERREYRKQLRAVLIGNVAFHIRRLVAESFAEQIPQDTDWPLIRDLRNNHREVFQVIYYQAWRIEWFHFWERHLVPVLFDLRDTEGLSTHLHRSSVWKNEDTKGVLEFGDKLLQLDYIDKSKLVWSLSSILKDIDDKYLEAAVPLLEKLLDLPRPKHHILGESVARCSLAGVIDDAKLWQYITSDINDKNVREYLFNNKLHCKSHEFGNNRKNFLKERLKNSVKLLDLAINSIEEWSQINSSNYDAEDKKFSSHFLFETSYNNEHSQTEFHHTDNVDILFDGIEKAILNHAQTNSEWWQVNAERLCLNHEGALRYFGILGCKANPHNNICLIKNLITDKNMLKSRLSYELGLLIRDSFVFLNSNTQEVVIQAILSLHQGRFEDERDLQWVLSEKSELISFIPCYLRSPEAQLVLDDYEQANGTMIPKPDIIHSGGTVRAPFPFNVFLESSDNTVLRLINHYYGYERTYDDSLMLTGGEEQVGRQLEIAASRQPIRFLKMLHTNWNDIPNCFCNEIMNGIANHLAYRYGNLKPSDDWESLETSEGAVLANHIIDELERHPNHWYHNRAASSAVRACAHVINDTSNATRLIFLCLGYVNYQEKRIYKDRDLIFAGINMTSGHIAEAVIILANNLLENNITLPELLAPTLLRFARSKYKAHQALILRRLPYLQSKNFDLGWKVFYVAMEEPTGLWKYAESCLYYAYREHFNIVEAILDKMYNKGREEELETWGRISALASLFGHLEQYTLLNDLKVKDSTDAWKGVADVWTCTGNIKQFRKQCLAGIEAGLKEDMTHAVVVAHEMSGLFREDNIILFIPIKIIQLYLNILEKIPNDDNRDLFGIDEWLNIMSQHDPEYALTASEIFLDFINKLGLILYDYEDNFPQLITRLFAEAEEREEVDNGAMLQRVVSLQDTLLAKGISNINDWLKAAERP